MSYPYANAHAQLIIIFLWLFHTDQFNSSILATKPAQCHLQSASKEQYLPDPCAIVSAEKDILIELDKCVENLLSMDLFSSKAPQNIKEDHAIL
jgi:hypothetical protein